MKRIALFLSLFSTLTLQAQTLDKLIPKDIVKSNKENPTPSVLDEKESANKILNRNPFAISQHKRNYILPFTHVKNPNTIGDLALNQQNVDHLEAKFQISMKAPLYLAENDNSGIYFGFSAVSFWQVYNDEVSKPFRETNYEPEIFYQWDTDLTILGYRFNMVQAGFNHQSNGQSGLRSRSWNRLFATALFSDEDSMYYVKSWIRVPEDEKQDITDPEGDDNPDINDYWGRIEIGYGAEVGPVDVLIMLRNNLDFSDNRGGFEFNLTYPLADRYDLLLQYFNGYGDSLIDYNRHQQRIGVGLQLRFF